MLNFFLRTPPAVCTTSARRHQRQVLFVLFILIAFNSAKQHLCDISNTPCECEKEEVIFLTRSEFFLLSASAYPVAQLDSSITHDCLTRIWDFGFHRFENQNRSIQRGWKCSRIDNNRSIPAQYNSQWFMLKDISRFSFLDLERAFKEYRFPRKAV